MSQFVIKIRTLLINNIKIAIAILAPLGSYNVFLGGCMLILIISFISINNLRKSIAYTYTLNEESSLLAQMEINILNQASIEEAILSKLLQYTPFENSGALGEWLEESAACSGEECISLLTEMFASAGNENIAGRPIEDIVVEAVSEVVMLVPGCDTECFSPETIAELSESSLPGSSNQNLLNLLIQLTPEQETMIAPTTTPITPEHTATATIVEATPTITPTPSPTQIENTTIIKDTMIYLGPSNEYSLAGTLIKGTEITILSVENNGFWITDIPGRPGVIAWVHSSATNVKTSDYINSLRPTSTPTTEPTVTEVDTISITRSTLAYFGPGKEYGVIGSLPQNAEVKVVGIGTNGYWIVEFPNKPGLQAWIKSSDTSVSTSSYHPQPGSNTTILPVPAVDPPPQPTWTLEPTDIPDPDTPTPISTPSECF